MTTSILIIYTGGTIGMVKDPETGVLCPFNFEQISQQTPELRRFGYKIDCYTLPNIIDSSDMTPNTWILLCNIIRDNYNRYSGFVILHGTDTMAYTASALSFMLVNLLKPVVLTGSQLPIGTIRTDGRENLIAAIEIAAAYIGGKAIVPEVSVLFGDKLWRGNRCTKINAERFDAFRSFNYSPLAEVGIHIHYNYDAINYIPRAGNFCINVQMDTRVAILKLFPGIDYGTVKAITEIPGLRGIVLESYGSGNAPTSMEFLKLLETAIKRGVIICNITQCKGGSVEMQRYSTGNQLLNIGVVSGNDMTTEAAVCKMMYLLGNANDVSWIKKNLNLCLAGELTVNRVDF